MNKKKFLKLQKETITNVDLIPKDTLYCYTPDEERNKNKDNWKYLNYQNPWGLQKS